MPGQSHMYVCTSNCSPGLTDMETVFAKFVPVYKVPVWWFPW